MLSILGVGAVFNLHPALRQAAQVAGGAYLCFLAYRLWRGGVQMAPVGTLTLSRSAAFRRGFLTNVLNPKSVLFFGSVFATSLPPNPGWPLIVAAVALVWVNAFAWHMALAMVFSQQRVQVAYRRFSTAFGWMAGAFLGAFGVRLLFSTWREWRTRLA
jgi:threonine efflux protein